MRNRLFLQIDLARSERYGLNTSQAVLAGYIAGLLTQKPKNVGDEDYYLADYSYIADDCSLLGKTDTVRRLCKQLEEKGLFVSLKIGAHNYITPSEDLRKWAQFTDKEIDENAKNGTLNEDTHFIRQAEKNPQGAEKNPQGAENFPFPTYIKNKIKNKSKNNKERTQTLFAPLSPEEEERNFLPQEKEPKGTSDLKSCLFANSRYHDYEAFAKCFADKPEFANIDINYYYHAISDWSASKGAKKIDWIATARNFMRSDMSKNKLVTLPNKQSAAEEIQQILNSDGLIWD